MTFYESDNIKRKMSENNDFIIEITIKKSRLGTGL